MEEAPGSTLNNITEFLSRKTPINKEEVHKLSIAPMLDVTNRYFRVFVRMLSKKVTFYTEMIHCDALLNNADNVPKLLGFDLIEKPLVFQFGGNDPLKLAKAAKIVE